MSAPQQIQKDRHKSKEILTGCGAIVVGFSETNSELFVVEASQALFEQAKTVQDNKEQQVFFETSQYLETNTEQLNRFFERAIKKRFEDAYCGAPFEPENSDSPNDSGLSLVNAKQMEIDVAIKGMTHRIDTQCTQALYCLTQRMAMLNQGVKIEDNAAPYSAKFLSQTFCEFILGVELELPKQLLLLKLFERSFIAKLPELYREINNYLVSSNVLPNLRFGKGGSDKQPRRRKSDQQQADSQNRQTQLYEALESLFNAPQSPIDPAQPMMSAEQAISELITNQQPAEDLLAQRATGALPKTNSVSLQTALDCIALLFDLVDQQNSLSYPVKNLFSHLRTPYAQLALSDPSFFADPQHQARQLIQSLVSASERWTDEETSPTHELIQKIKLVIERVISDASQSQNDPAQYGTLLEEFNDYIDSFERKIKLTEERSVQAAQGREKLKENQLRVEQLLVEKIKDLNLPKPVAEFITDTWASYMTYLLLRFGEDSEQWKAASSSIDSILWYIEPKLNAEENEKADELRKDLHAVLTQGMEQVGLTTADIKSKLKSLDLCRQLASENASSAQQPEATSVSESTARAEPSRSNQVNAEPSTQEKIPADSADAADSLADDYAALEGTLEPLENSSDKSTESIENVEGAIDTAFEESSTSTAKTETPAKTRIQRQKEAIEDQQSPVEEPDNIDDASVTEEQIQTVLNLKFGTWLDWEEPDKPSRRLKLTWLNRKTTNCMVSNKAGQEVGIFSARTIALGMQTGSIRIVEDTSRKPVFEKMLEKFSKRKAAR